tara:strand:+ start:977 stop:2161 length:1185 start_codon:yes stop_codon:yes gene_type:complete
MKSFDISDHIYRLLQDEPFFAALSRQINKREDNSIPTAGIKYNKNTKSFEMFYNSEFMQQFESPQQKFILMHEMYHASFGHCTFRKWKGVDHKLANLAMDLAINSLEHMRKIAIEEACMPGKGPFEYITLYEQAAEWYLKQIEEDKKANPEKYKEMDSFDDHSDFGEGGDDIDREIASEQLKEAISKAVRECEEVSEKTGRAKGWGSVSTAIRKEIKTSCGVNFKLDPKKVLSSFIKTSINAEKKTSVTKRNRRLPGKKFGRRSERRANIAISIDQSGSVSDELLAKVFDWLGEFAKFVSFTVVPFDHDVFEEKIYVWKKGERRQRERVLHGGTDFNAPTQWVNGHKFDGHIIVTDMLAPKPIRSNCQRMWITDKWGASSTYFQPVGERVLILD